MNGRPQLRRLRRALEARRQIPDDVRQFAIEALERFEAGTPIDRAMRVRAGPAAREARNEHLRRAFAAMPTHLSVSDCASRILASVKNLEAFIDDPEAGVHIRGWHWHILRALQVADLPGERMLRKVGSEARDCQKFKF